MVSIEPVGLVVIGLIVFVSVLGFVVNRYM
jgi:hypothetical protein